MTIHRFCSFSVFCSLGLGACIFYLLEVAEIFVVALTIDLCTKTLLSVVIWKMMLAKPIVGVVKEHARNGVVVVLTNQGFPGC